MCYSDRGFGDLSVKYHRCIRNHICNGARSRRTTEMQGNGSSETGFVPRPVLVNSWEAAYFNFTGETILELAREAA